MNLGKLDFGAWGISFGGYFRLPHRKLELPVEGLQVIWCPAPFLLPCSGPQMHTALIRQQVLQGNKTPPG